MNSTVVFFESRPYLIADVYIRWVVDDGQSIDITPYTDSLQVMKVAAE